MLFAVLNGFGVVNYTDRTVLLLAVPMKSFIVGRLLTIGVFLFKVRLGYLNLLGVTRPGMSCYQARAGNLHFPTRPHCPQDGASTVPDHARRRLCLPTS